MDKIQFMKMFLQLGNFANYDEKEDLAFKERIVFATEGIIKPYDWEELTFKERQLRMNNLLKEI
ncbi:MAG: hypothetical protein Unbinned8210contig1002_36 [Prokaryotic dsDNA virus sp.]|nr:MAG: hypothetical protein Unbinned8210contig1002_36 [Prokaryotic dsDNA virus sp.]|tara:strand:- start:287 stop:478 length:192 start_codon:yes stop_codon:yes gene_type:complete